MRRIAIISLCIALPWAGALAPRACFGLDSAEVVAGMDQADQGLRSSAGVMKIYAIDVGQGDSALVVFPDSSNMLIDCGRSSHAGNIKSLLGRLGIGKLNRVIVTHGDNDHAGGYSSLQSGGFIDSSTQRYDWTNTSPGNIFYSNAAATVTCVTSNYYIIDGGYVPEGGTNGTSVGVVVHFRGFDYLSCGDLEESAEDLLGNKLAVRGDKIDVLKVDHHGSRYSSSSYFLQKIMPEFAVIMVGDNNGYGHPTQETIDRLNNPAVHVQRIFQTERGDPDSGTASDVTVADGQIVITTDGATYTFGNEGPGSNPFSYGPYKVDEYVTAESPHLMITEAAISDSYFYPENNRWVELYLPPGALPVDLSSLYWVSRDNKEQLAKHGPLTMIPEDVAIMHMTESTDTVDIDESDSIGKGANGWWDLYTQRDGNYWYGTDDCLMISRENSLTPNPLNIIDSVMWSDDDGGMAQQAMIIGNYLIRNFHWGSPIAGSGSYTATDQSASVGSIGNGYAQRITTIDTDSEMDWQISTVNSEGTPPPTPTPIPTPPPPVDLVVNAPSLAAGDLLIVSVVVQPVAGRPFDGYAVIVGKAGIFSIQPGNRLQRGVVPIVRNIRSLPSGYSGVLLNLIVPPGVSGDYRVIAGLVDAGGTVRSLDSTFANDLELLTVR